MDGQMKKQVFISYSSKEQNIAYEIKNALESHGISCWMAPESIPSGSDYASEIPQGIDEAIVLTLLLSDASQSSCWVEKEVLRAVSNGKIVIPFMISKCDIGQKFGFILSNIQRLDAYNAYEENLNKLAQIVRGIIVAKESGRVSDDIHDKDIRDRIIRYLDNQIPYIESNASQPCPVFVGRDYEIEEINAHLKDNNILFIHGLGGLGKSEIVKMYAHRFKINYDVTIFMRYENGLKQDLDTIAIETLHNLHEKEDEKEEDYCNRKIKKWRELLNDRTLLIIDNLDNPDEEDFDILRKLHCKVLVTSRVNFSEVSHQITIEPIRDKETVMELFCTHYERALMPEQQEVVFDLLQYIDFHTMMVKLLALQMKNSEISPEEMLKAMKNNLTVAGEETFRVMKDDKLVLEKAYGHLKRLFQIIELEEDKKSVLISFSILCRNKLKKDLFKKLAGLKNYNAINRLVELGWLQEDREGFLSIHRLIKNLCLELLEENETECDAILEDLLCAFDNSFLLVKSEDNKVKMSKNVMLKLCEIISQNLVLTKQTYPRIIKFYEKMIQINDARNYANKKIFKEEIINSIVEIWADALEKSGDADAKTQTERYTTMGVTLLTKAYSTAALSLFEKALKTYSIISDTELALKLYLLIVQKIGLVYSENKYYRKAMEYLETSLKAHCDGYKLSDILFAYTFAALFRCYCEVNVPMQRVNDMCNYLLGLEGQEKKYDIWISPLIDGMDSLGIYLIRNEQYSRAESVYGKLLILIGQEWDSRYIVPRIYGKLAHIYELQGEQIKEEFALLKGIQENNRPLVEYGNPEEPDYYRESDCFIEDAKAGAFICNLTRAFYQKCGNEKKTEEYRKEFYKNLGAQKAEIDTYCEFAVDPKATEKEIYEEWEAALKIEYPIVSRQTMPWSLWLDEQ